MCICWLIIFSELKYTMKQWKSLNIVSLWRILCLCLDNCTLHTCPSNSCLTLKIMKVCRCSKLCLLSSWHVTNSVHFELIHWSLHFQVTWLPHASLQTLHAAARNPYAFLSASLQLERTTMIHLYLFFVSHCKIYYTCFPVPLLIMIKYYHGIEIKNN
jgi:hypothetical protein